VCFGGIKTKGKTLEVMAHLKKSIIEVKAETNCLAHAPIIAITKMTRDPNYIAYRQGRKIHSVVDNLLTTTRIDLGNGWGNRNYSSFRNISISIKP
jgi:hypothetical protein